MIKLDKKENCSGCSACYSKCPNNAIKMEKDEKGFFYPKIEEEKCTQCGLCDKICPILNNKKNDKNAPRAFAAYNKNTEIRQESSSGGIFTLLAKEILKEKGIIYGASWDKNLNVHHISVNNENDLKLLRGSKYLQSRIEDTYKEAEKNLKDGKMVYFSGTPCQIEGLKSYLMKEYENLYTQDLICHGVPSEKVNQQYIEYIKEKKNSNIESIEHRSKITGWKKFSVKIKFEDGTEYAENLRNDIYMKAFLRNTSLRESCYNCAFKKENRVSDFTLADFWGIENIYPELDDDRGTSLVIVNTEKGMKLFEKIKNEIEYKEIEFEKAIKYNKNMCKSEVPDKNRKKFFDNLEKTNFDELVKKYTSQPGFIKKIMRRCKNKIKKIIRR